MKFVKRISLFFVICGICMGVGFFLGNQSSKQQNHGTGFLTEKKGESEEETKVLFRAASAGGEDLIDADTLFLVEETDIRKDTFVETEWELPDKYIGMNREEFLTAMEEYELSPPLSELERGFVSLEVKSFSEKEVLVRMNYAYTPPSTSFYLMAEKHQLVVYCDDKETLYLKTNIKLDTLPEELRSQIINGMFVQDEKTLYYILESYSS